MFNTSVKHEIQSKLNLYFYHCCDFKNCGRSPYKAKCLLHVPSLKCTWYQPIVGLKCELGEIQLLGKGNCKLLNSTKKKHKEYKINKWNVNISYFIFSNFTKINETTKNIQTVLTEVQNNTCIKFFKKNETINQNGINFLKSNKCESEVIGMKSENESQYIYLTDECSYSMRKIRSLLYETLGLLPPVLRKDRNKYVTLKFLYMNQSKVTPLYDYYKPINNSLGPYDLGSITHYIPTLFTFDKHVKTIEPNERYKMYYENMIGRIEEPSFFDYRTINKYYCSDICKKNECEDSGYNDPKNCSKCIERIDFSYIFSNNITDNLNSNCGYYLIYAGDHLKHFIQSRVTTCLYYIRTLYNTGKVYVRFPSFRGTFIKKECSLKNSIEIIYKSNLDVPGLFLCYNDDFETIELISDSIFMTIIYRFEWYETYAYFEYKRTFDNDFKYEKLSKLEKIPLLRNETDDKINDCRAGKCA
uniref:Metalloendopeptidase n=1 Tax=Parastrongyloides trichosuri TaxID=131310 RepID=A0A0N4ZL45_PARTI